jgi:hypothetical protein
MSHARYSVPICLLKDSFIVAAGGAITTGTGIKKFTNACEVLDIFKNTWSIAHSMDKPRAQTSLCAVANRHVFAFNGLP